MALAEFMAGESEPQVSRDRLRVNSGQVEDMLSSGSTSRWRIHGRRERATSEQG